MALCTQATRQSALICMLNNSWMLLISSRKPDFTTKQQKFWTRQKSTTRKSMISMRYPYQCKSKWLSTNRCRMTRGKNMPPISAYISLELAIQSSSETKSSFTEQKQTRPYFQWKRSSKRGSIKTCHSQKMTGQPRKNQPLASNIAE